MLGRNDYRVVTDYPAYSQAVGFTQEGMPFKVGDRVMDDRGRIGTVAGISMWEREPSGSLSNYAVCIRYGWDSDAYGLERIATKGEFSLVNDDGELTQEC